MTKKRIEYLDEQRKDILMEAWIGRHWKQILIFTIVTIFITITWSMINISGLKKSIFQQAKAIENLSKRVIVASPDGRVVVLQTSNVPDAYLTMILKDIVTKYLIFSAFEITNAYEGNNEKLLQSEKVLTFIKYFCEKSAVNDYKALLNMVWNAYKNGDLPEFVYVSSPAEDIFKSEKNVFYYKLILPVFIYSVKEGKWFKGKTNITFEIQGVIDFAQSVAENPWGIKIKTFKSTIPVNK